MNVFMTLLTPPTSYAYRKSMTDVLVLDLQTNEEVVIRCRDLVKKISLYNDRLAVCDSPLHFNMPASCSPRCNCRVNSTFTTLL